MNIGVPAKGFTIQSKGIYRGILAFFSLFLICFFAAEALFDLHSTTLEILLPLTVITLLLAAFSFRFPHLAVLKKVIVIIVYIFIEIHFLVYPTIYHAVIYWFPLVPLLALVIRGIKTAQVWLGVVLMTQVINFLIVQQTVGGQYTLTVHRTPFLAAGIIFTLIMLGAAFLLYLLLGQAYTKMKVKNEELERARKTIEYKKDLLEKYHQVLITLSRDDLMYGGGHTALFEKICKTAVSTLAINRVSIWLFDNNNAHLSRMFLYEVSSGTDAVLALTREEYPVYFETLEKLPYILASDARTHEATQEFTENYLKPLNIYSLLDCPITLDRKTIGVICCEHQHEYKNWNPEDTLFVQSLADLVSMSYKNDRIGNLLNVIRKKNNELVGKNKEILAMNEELSSLNEELTRINESLEETVRHRTSELEAQNLQLTEYAFINSHLLRAPLTRILGLTYLLSREATTVRETELLGALLNASNEMDAIIRRISDILYSGNNMTRDDIQMIIKRNLNREIE